MEIFLKSCFQTKIVKAFLMIAEMKIIIINTLYDLVIDAHQILRFETCRLSKASGTCSSNGKLNYPTTKSNISKAIFVLFIESIDKYIQYSLNIHV